LRYEFKGQAFYRPQEAFVVVGTMNGWGTIVIHELGFRCQNAYPATLHVVACKGRHDEAVMIARYLGEGYGVAAKAARIWEFF
jgi:hypothetical protein